MKGEGVFTGARIMRILHYFHACHNLYDKRGYQMANVTDASVNTKTNVDVGCGLGTSLFTCEYDTYTNIQTLGLPQRMAGYNERIFVLKIVLIGYSVET